MGVLQSGLNQALTGATFLLQQTPGWKEEVQKNAEFRNAIKESNAAYNLMKSGKESMQRLARRNIKSEKQAENIKKNISEIGRRYDIGENINRDISTKIYADPRFSEKYMKAIDRGKVKEFEGENAYNKALRSIQEKLSMYEQQKKQVQFYKEQLKAMGISDKAIKGAKLN